MNKKLRIIAIVAVAFWGAGAIFLIMYFFNTKFFGGYIGAITLACYAVGIILYLALYIMKAFPFQQAKIEEMKKLEDDYYKKLNENEAKDEPIADSPQDAPQD